MLAPWLIEDGSERMWIMVSGPYRSGAAQPSQQAANLRALNDAALTLFRAGHVPIVGVNLALPLIDAAGGCAYDTIMLPLSLALATRCDACLRVGGASAGADREVGLLRGLGKPVYVALEDVPPVLTKETCFDERTMTDAFAGTARIEGYHAHVYYESTTRPLAERLRQAMGERFAVTLGRWHDQPVGPHPQSMYQVAFAVAAFARLVPWLMLNRAGLSILVHPRTGNDYEDHARFPLWLGTPLALRLEVLRQRSDSD
jgi:aromatic ring-cleaving dioxygenase